MIIYLFPFFFNIYMCNWQNYRNTKVGRSGHGMLKFECKPSLLIGDHPLTDTLFFHIECFQPIPRQGNRLFSWGVAVSTSVSRAWNLWVTAEPLILFCCVWNLYSRFHRYPYRYPTDTQPIPKNASFALWRTGPSLELPDVQWHPRFTTMFSALAPQVWIWQPACQTNLQKI